VVAPVGAPDADVAKRVAEALDDFDFRRATAAVWTIVEEANRYVARVRPWELARDPARAKELDDALATLVGACRLLGEQLVPFLPDAAARVSAQCTPVDGRLPVPIPLFLRI
jgi:methionyl-tRNA synthetase